MLMRYFFQELRSLGVPDKYCKEVERKVHEPTERHMFSVAAAGK